MVVAHRGSITDPIASAGTANGGKPLQHNTIAAIVAAAEQGADAVEVDVRRTRDGHLVLCHDPFAWGGHRLKRPFLVSRTRRSTVPALPGLDEAVDTALSCGLAVKLDIKTSGDLSEVATRVRDRGWDGNRVALWCRSPQRIRALGADPAIEVALVSNSRDGDRYAADAADCGATAVSLHPKTLSADSVRAARDRGLTVYAWILDPARQRAAVDLGVDGLVTDWVADARDVIG